MLPRSVIWWYGLGTALLAGLIGVSIGLSESPVVAVVVPLFLALVSGGGGFYVAKADLSQADERQRLVFLGKLLSVFSIMALVGAVYGALVRTGAPVASLFLSAPAHEDNAAFDYATLSPDQALQVAALGLRLRSMGVERDQVDKILHKARGQLNQQISPELRRAISEIQEAAAKAKQYFPNPPSDDDVKTYRLNDVIKRVTEIEQTYGNLARVAATSAVLDNVKVTSRINQDFQSMSGFAVFNAAAGFQAKYPDLFQSLVQLYSSLSVPFVSLGTAEWYTSLNSSDFMEQVDNLIKITRNPNETPEEAAPKPRPYLRKSPPRK